MVEYRNILKIPIPIHLVFIFVSISNALVNRCTPSYVTSSRPTVNLDRIYNVHKRSEKKSKMWKKIVRSENPKTKQSIVCFSWFVSERAALCWRRKVNKSYCSAGLCRTIVYRTRCTNCIASETKTVETVFWKNSAGQVLLAAAAYITSVNGRVPKTRDIHSMCKKFLRTKFL